MGVMQTMTLPPEVSTTTAAARAGHATKAYRHGDTAVRALDDVPGGVPAGRFPAVMGPAGSGKSTLLHVLAGLDTLTSGQVFVGGTDLATLKDRRLTELRRDRLGFVFQAYNLVPTLTALENITLPASLGGHEVDPPWLDEVVTTVGLGDRLHHRPAAVSRRAHERGGRGP